mmetsp:Transcript_71730/g.154884  ORF Transcript_71730/g.154884 Transcript_71730/m.154884 type:complete len:200 (+) Transcript_71730:762-1361(+)
MPVRAASTRMQLRSSSGAAAYSVMLRSISPPRPAPLTMLSSIQGCWSASRADGLRFGSAFSSRRAKSLACSLRPAQLWLSSRAASTSSKLVKLRMFSKTGSMSPSKSSGQEKGGSPARSSMAVHAMDQMSAFSVCSAFPARTSGGMYAGVPTKSRLEPARAARPKSMSFRLGLPQAPALFVSIMFWGLMSRCTTPQAWQ